MVISIFCHLYQMYRPSLGPGEGWPPQCFSIYKEHQCQKMICTFLLMSLAAHWKGLSKSVLIIGEITWENCSNLTHENVNLLVIYYQNVCLLFLPAVHWLTDSWGSAMELPGWKWTNCLYFSLLLFIFIVIIIILNKRMLLFSGKVKGNPKDTGEI